MRILRHALPVAAMLAFAPALSTIPAFAQVSVNISVAVAPPELPVYAQPVIPGPGYLWVPGYWAYADADYYWVPGTWVEPPQVGLLWTPGYWAFADSEYVWNAGYWGPEVGFYGGIDYGFGYTGRGYFGGRWEHGVFAYNAAVNNVEVRTIKTTYRENVASRSVARVSFNGGKGGVAARPTAQEEVVAHARHTPPTAAQEQHVRAAASDRDLRASVNRGKPAIAATDKPGDFKGHVSSATQAGTISPETRAAEEKGGGTPPANRNAARPGESRPNAEARPAATPENRNAARPEVKGPNAEARPATTPENRSATRPDANRPTVSAPQRPEENRNAARPVEGRPNAVAKPETPVENHSAARPEETRPVARPVENNSAARPPQGQIPKQTADRPDEPSAAHAPMPARPEPAMRAPAARPAPAAPGKEEKRP